MHQLIRAIVYAKNKEEGLEKAKEIFESLCENQYPYDYYSTFDKESPRKRWGNLPVITLANSKIGKKLIEDGWRSTKQEFYRNLKIIREILKKKSNYQLLLKSFDDNLFRYRCYLIGEFRGSSCFLYDNDGEGIKSVKHLNYVLNKWNNEKKYKGLKIYVVPADVHF